LRCMSKNNIKNRLLVSNSSPTPFSWQEKGSNNTPLSF
jgi:hypothetical protein